MTNISYFLNAVPISTTWYTLSDTKCIYIETTDSGFVFNTDMSQHIHNVMLMRKGNVLAAKILTCQTVGRLVDEDGDIFIVDVPYSGDLLREFVIELKLHTGLSIDLKKVVDAYDEGWIR